MDLQNVEKKLREAQFFLGKMNEQKHMAFGDKEPFDFYLSAFLNAPHTVDYRLRHEQPAYRGWRKAWDKKLAPAEGALMKFMADDRNVEVHESGSGRIVKPEDIPVVGDRYSDRSGTGYVIAPPGTPPAVIHVPTYNFKIAGSVRKATDVCGEYLTLLNQMLTKFKADNP
jgi:hypothetical protein